MADIKLRPLADRLVIEPVEQEDRTQSGLFIPETAKEKPSRASSCRVPDSTEGSSERIPLDVKKGDKVLFAKYSGTEFKIDGKELKILKESDVLAVISDN
jgi:chaperonin GroES